MLCQYKDIFGKEGTGLHSYRILNIAVVDVISTVVAAKLISINFKVDFIKTLIVLFILGVISHRLFCVRTTIDKLLF